MMQALDLPEDLSSISSDEETRDEDEDSGLSDVDANLIEDDLSYGSDSFEDEINRVIEADAAKRPQSARPGSARPASARPGGSRPRELNAQAKNTEPRAPLSAQREEEQANPDAGPEQDDDDLQDADASASSRDKTLPAKKVSARSSEVAEAPPKLKKLDTSRIKVETMDVNALQKPRPHTARASGGSPRKRFVFQRASGGTHTPRRPRPGTAQPHRSSRSEGQHGSKSRGGHSSHRKIRMRSPSPSQGVSPRPRTATIGGREPTDAMLRTDKRNAQLLAENLLLKAEVERLKKSQENESKPAHSIPQPTAEDMVQLRSLNHSVLLLVEDITRETGKPLVIHGLNYAQKIRCDLVLP
ncbi:Hypothetical Protein FCC1311_080472 [Hondaea fermentalgiana]|uniref:Uncharacterized protein n=1 Tax=Hondaea fermentalgiana TaxID=2315210 RepID=A0A2R5GLP4_9STRA|nr:Hypothetical Protein FCC1311_080472 [Hondaea fermentalgiana]|eukprot:GBG31822.1 Hypothetical Protein FCC1311_080472 [Hondaea fermentalgiana]